MNSAVLLADLHAEVPILGPSLLACDFANVEREVRRLEEAGARILHLDIMDGHFVPNLSFGVPVVQAIRRVTELPLDVHLMISDPGKYIGPFRGAGADILTVHIEVVPEPTAILDSIRGLGAAAGLSLNPPTPLSALEPFANACDVILVMSVMPGFGGQEFDPVALDKLRRLREVTEGRVLLSVDGGVNEETIGPCAEAGADILVMGTALLGHPDYRRRMADMHSLALTRA